MSTEGCKLSNRAVLHCGTVGGRWWPTQQVPTTFPDFPSLQGEPLLQRHHPALPCPNLACNLDFAQDDTTAPSRAKAARVSSRGASASSLATSAEATRSARLRSMRGTAANTAGCKSALEWGCAATLPGWPRPKKAGE